MLRLDNWDDDEDDDAPYPTSDGRPLGETDVHRRLITDLIHALEVFYLSRDDVYVSGNLLLFYEEGNRRRHLSPDVLVTLGIPRRERDNYLIWQEGKAPDMIFEISSATTKFEDIGAKKGLYASFGVKEYCIFDPLKEYLEPRLRLYRLAGDDYVPVTGNPLQLETLGLQLRVVEDTLRLFNPLTASLLPTRTETVSTLAEQEQSLAAKDAEILALQEELRKLRGE